MPHDPLYNAKDILERLSAMNSRNQSPMSALSELQELIDRADKAVEECYQAEMDLEAQNELLTAYERGGAA